MYGARWCPHCTSSANLLEENKEKLEEAGVHVEVTYCDMEENSKTCQDAGIKAYPTFKSKCDEKMGAFQSVDHIIDFAGKCGSE